MTLHERIATALGWKVSDTQSMSLHSLREMVRPVSAKLAHEIDVAIASHSVIVGPRRRSTRRDPRRLRRSRRDPTPKPAAPLPKVYRDLAEVSRRKQEIWEAYHAGKIDMAKHNVLHHRLELKRQKLRDQSLVPLYKDGDVVEARWGERAIVTGAMRTEWQSLQYRILRGPHHEVRDIWPAESIARKVGRVKK